MYSVTTIRLNNLTKQFENTEERNMGNAQFVENELRRCRAEFKQVECFLDMLIGDSICIETEIFYKEESGPSEGLRFIYIARFA